MMGDFELLKEVPGYRAILKVVLKSQIQLLIDQLCNYTGEESFILTANASDGAQSLLGSGTGKGFLENHSEIKTQFLGYCLKSLHNPEETVSHHDSTRSKGRTHPYARGASSSPTANKPRSGFSDSVKLGGSDTTQLNDSRHTNSSSTIVYHSSVSATETYKRREPNSPHKSSIFQTSRMDFKDRLSDIYHQDHVQTPGDYDQTDQGQAQESDSVVVKTELESDDVEVTGVELGNHLYGDENLGGQFSSDSNQTAASPDDFAMVNSVDRGGILDMNTSESNIDNLSASKHYYPCRYCGRVFQHNSWLTRHIRGHTGEKPYECRVCGKRFTRSGTMKVHTLMHNIK
ncbi:zinc finger and SCAN domain-containing protein 20-like [Mercenaria mercenaria]|uniref:zinc finger and SCAN domain-containing protein 20-like n=1 Tax=Mercenaria mercenaria TaxID=6596 RepID=UPI00234F126B|nr:zinc finger and SCAN domain-containing protein 20-like [Mercenaria mercenaria]